MVISSRTPEGDPGRCFVCGHNCRLDPSWPGRDAPCPSCGHLLWFPESGEPKREDTRSLVLRLLQMRFGPLPADAAETVERLVAESGQEVFERVLLASGWEEFVSGGGVRDRK